MLLFEGTLKVLWAESAYPIVLDGCTAPSEYHEYKARRYKWEGHRQQIRKAGSPDDVRRVVDDFAARNIPYTDRWRSRRLQVRLRILRAKARLHPSVRDALLSTGSAALVSTLRHRFWGIGPDGSGPDHLAKLWLIVRSELQQKQMKAAE